jgi:signal peptidase II
MKQRIYYFLLIIILVLADQVTKSLISRSIYLNSRVEVIPGFFQLVHIRNKGAIFGFFNQSGSQLVYLLLTIASFIALGLVIYYFFKAPASEKFLRVYLSLILAGALGNFIDRLFRGYVVDFLDFSIRGWHWPSFNVADSCITIGALMLVSVFLFKRSPKCSLSS